MRSIWICLALAGVIALLIIVPHMFISDTAQDMHTILKRTDTAVDHEDWHQAQKLCSQVIKKWEKSAKVIEMIVEHEEIDGIIRSLRQLSRYISEKEKPEARALIGEVEFLIKHLDDTDSLSMENIF